MNHDIVCRNLLLSFVKKTHCWTHPEKRLGRGPWKHLPWQTMLRLKTLMCVTDANSSNNVNGHAYESFMWQQNGFVCCLLINNIVITRAIIWMTMMTWFTKWGRFFFPNLHLDDLSCIRPNQKFPMAKKHQPNLIRRFLNLAVLVLESSSWTVVRVVCNFLAAMRRRVLWCKSHVLGGQNATFYAVCAHVGCCM